MLRNKRILIYLATLTIIVFLPILLQGVLSANTMNKWSVLDSYDIDLNNDGKLEKVTLSSEVEVDSSGNILWDDSQWWKLSVHNGKEEVLYKEYITLGNVYISIGVEKGKKLASIVLVNDTDDSLTILKFYYEKNDKVYKKENVLFINKQVHSAIPNSYLKPKNN